MSKGLQALQQLKAHHYGTIESFDKKLSIIEKELKALQLIIDRRCDIRYVGFFVVDSHELPMSKEEVKFVEDVLNER